MQTVSKRLDKIPDFDWIISDESHLSVCETWSKIIRRFENSWHLGMSASPTRTDGTGLGVHFDCLVNGPGIGELIKLGFLCNIRTYAPAADVGFIRSSYGEYLMSDASSKYDKPHITGDVISHYKKLADNKKALVFCCSVEHADHVAKEFRIAGYSAINVDGSMDKTTRAERIRDFRIGKIQVLTNCDLLTTGFDCSDIEVGIMLRPTQSLSLYIQMVGRIYRVHYGKKEAILIDAVGNVTRHGMPNEDRKWTLADTEKKSKGTTTPQMSVKICPKCFAAQESGLSSCTFCGFVFEVQARVIEQVDGELEEIKSVNKRQEQGSAKNYEQLVILGRQRGMKHPEGWARHVMAARGKKYG